MIPENSSSPSLLWTTENIYRKKVLIKYVGALLKVQLSEGEKTNVNRYLEVFWNNSTDVSGWNECNYKNNAYFCS